MALPLLLLALKPPQNYQNHSQDHYHQHYLYRVINPPYDRQRNRETEKDRKTEKQTLSDRQTEKQRDRETEKQRDRQSDRQTVRQTTTCAFFVFFSSLLIIS